MVFPDSPISDPSLDKFNRSSFSHQIAEIITSRRDPSSIVIGIYGAWGEGKTTVFNFIEQSLENKPALDDESEIVCVRFNPWLVRDEDTLLISFYNTIATALEKKIKTKLEEVAGRFKKYGSMLGSLSIADLSGTARMSGAAVEKLGDLFSQVELEEQKKRIEDFLKESKKRIVVFIDDIDRLENSEIQSIFKLIKLSASFDNTVYLLAFDEKKLQQQLLRNTDLVI